jgi:hypothetical protein
MNIFYAATEITLGNGLKAPFWEAPWLQGRKPKEIAPLIFAISGRKTWKVAQAMKDNAWVGMIKLDGNFTMDHFNQFVELWNLLQEVHIDENAEDEITWRLTANGQYSSKSAYEVQFLGSITSTMYKTVWKAWAPPKTKFFAWLLTQKRIWTADRLQKRGWPNCGLCPLCKQTTESIDHLFVGCRFTLRIWGYIREWLGIPNILPNQWTGLPIKTWWDKMTSGSTPNRKAIASLTLLVTWEVWNERNARVFRNNHSPSMVVLDRIKREARLWVLAGAKCLGVLTTGE